MNGSLLDLLKSEGPLPEIKVAKYISDVLKALVYLHQEDIIHRDVKASNILIDQGGETKRKSITIPFSPFDID